MTFMRYVFIYIFLMLLMLSCICLFIFCSFTPTTIFNFHDSSTVVITVMMIIFCKECAILLGVMVFHYFKYLKRTKLFWCSTHSVFNSFRSSSLQTDLPPPVMFPTTVPLLSNLMCYYLDGLVCSPGCRTLQFQVLV